MWFSMFSFCTVSPSVCLDEIYLGLGSLVVTFWERATHSVKRMFSLLYLFVALVVSHFGFEDRNLVMTASVPGHCLPFTFLLLCIPLHVDAVVTINNSEHLNLNFTMRVMERMC